MIHPLPSGTRDVLPDEARELRAITDRVRVALAERDYGEIQTPALEYASVLELGMTPPAYRLFDEQGGVLALRSDMTVPIARVVATRYAQVVPPLRFSYAAHVYRAVRPQRGQARELLQAGIELIGSPGAAGTAEAIEVLCAALDASGLRGYKIGVGDAALFPALVDAIGVPPAAREALLRELSSRDFVGLEREVRALGLDPADAALLAELPQRRGGPEVLEPRVDALAGLRELHARLADRVRGRVIYDLGLVRHLGYYTGAVFEVYDVALGQPIGRGGRYDDLLGRFGRPLPAVGWALGVERLHLAVAGEAAA